MEVPLVLAATKGTLKCFAATQGDVTPARRLGGVEGGSNEQAMGQGGQIGLGGDRFGCGSTH